MDIGIKYRRGQYVKPTRRERAADMAARILAASVWLSVIAAYIIAAALYLPVWLVTLALRPRRDW
jgi:hypothetical protein